MGIDFNNKQINYDKLSVDKYLQDLRLIGSLSGLFSSNEIPFLHYRTTENFYCADFSAENLSRADVSADAKLKTKGIGIKTFIENAELQKIAEFNNQQELYRDLPPIEMIKKVAELRNMRMQFTMNAYGLNDLIYHCIVRNKQGFYLFEEKMDFIDVDKIKLKINKTHTFIFTDSKQEYKFDSSKSTLYKRFVTREYFANVPVDILTDPIEALRQIKLGNDEPVSFYETKIVPLYEKDKEGRKIIYERSGLNQWNANGRKRDCDEVYIPFNKDMRDLYENFFPARDTSFEVELPNGEIISMKTCSGNDYIGKSLMSNPNKALGKWLLRDVLKIPQGQVITYETLLAIGIDAISFQKQPNGKYKLDFRKIGEFEAFIKCDDG
ncbi:hypothetical protein AGMMS4956_20870 [Bacteroidia bacterium]|nr:hypothetical protein AGMMS4956_20870 [Bacteroidia bacterium]